MLVLVGMQAVEALNPIFFLGKIGNHSKKGKIGIILVLVEIHPIKLHLLNCEG